MDFIALAMGLAFSLMWSSAFATARIIVHDASPFTVLALRFLIAGVIAIGIAWAQGHRLRMTRQVALIVVIFGICQNALYLGLNFVAMQWVEGSLAAVIASSMPLMVALIGWLAAGERMRPLGVAGLVAGFFGVALIMESRITHGASAYGVALCLVGALALAVATRLVRGVSSENSLLMIVGLQMLVGAVVLGALAPFVEHPRIDATPALVAALGYQIFVPGIIATVIWFALVNRVGAVRAATFHFLNPFFGLLVAAALLGEPITVVDLIGVGIAMAGILAVQLSRAGVRV